MDSAVNKEYPIYDEETLHSETKQLDETQDKTAIQLTPPTTNGHAHNDTGSAHISAPMPIPTNGGLHAHSGSSTHNKSVALLEQEVRYLRDELGQAREMIRRLQDQEKTLRERLAGQVHRQFTTAPAPSLEDLSLGNSRPTALVRSYDNLYREGRVDTLDALDSLQELRGLDVLKMKILFSVVVLSFRVCQQHFQDLRGRLRHLLCLPLVAPPSPPSHPATPLDDDHAHRDPVYVAMETHISQYLTRTAQEYDIGNIVHEVCGNIYATLYDYPGLKGCGPLADYTAHVVRLSWALTVQVPAYVIGYDMKMFLSTHHDRFHSSDSESDVIRSFLWPVLIDGQSGQCVAKGIVIT